MSSTTLRRAYQIAPVAAVQAEYSVTERGVEGRAGTDLLAACRALGVAFVCETPLGRGLLSGTFAAAVDNDDDDMRVRALPRFQPANRGANAEAVAPFGALAARKGCSVSQLALAWLLKQGRDVFPMYVLSLRSLQAPGSRDDDGLIEPPFPPVAPAPRPSSTSRRTVPPPAST